MRPTTEANRIITLICMLVLILFAGIFFYTAFKSLSPLLWEKNKEIASIKLTEDLNDAAAYIERREDLTSQNFLATLDKEEANKSAELINGSGAPLDTETISEALKTAGITVGQVSNSQTPQKNTVIAFKESSLTYKQKVVDGIGTRSGEMRFEKLDDSYPFDIRITLGK